VEEFPVFCAATVTWLAIVIIVDSTWPAVSVVVMVMNVVGEGEDIDCVLDPGLEPSEVDVAVGIKLANEGGSVVCPDVNTAHAPARTEVNKEFRDNTGSALILFIGVTIDSDTTY
jgi:hypothetical protein